MLQLPRLAALPRLATRTLATSPVLATKHQPPFAFLPANALDPKHNRNKGLTEIRGPYYAPVTSTYLDELLSDWGEYVDGVKFAGGAFSLMPEDRLKGLIEVAHKHSEYIHIFSSSRSHVEADCYVSTGGFIERVLSASAGNKDVVSKYLTACKNMG